MGASACRHRYVDREAEDEVVRQCADCGSVMIDLDAAEDGLATVTRPGLFRPARPTIFSVLREEQIEQAVQPRSGPQFAFGGPPRGGRHRRSTQPR